MQALFLLLTNMQKKKRKTKAKWQIFTHAWDSVFENSNSNTIIIIIIKAKWVKEIPKTKRKNYLCKNQSKFT